MTIQGPAHLPARETARRPAPITGDARVLAAHHPLLQLQRTLGNAQVNRMVAQREAAPEEEEISAKHDPLLREAQPDEEEIGAKHDPLMRAGEEDELMMSADSVAPQVGLEGGAVGGDIAGRIESARGGGSPLDSGFRSRMESNLGLSLDSVRVHSGSEPDALNRAISARAFTTGSDIFLRSDVTSGDHHTMAHEVAHVAQQQSLQSSASGGMSVGPADSPHEREADDFAAAALRSPDPETETD
ncbi:MAG: DUF4157 domain-containing protein [Dehalococcoidia bacterium]